MSKKYSAAESVYRDVKEQILSGALPGGELISEGDVAARLGVSRTPVREAFLRLESEGWMRLYPKRGALVVPVAQGEAEQVLEARYLIEAHCARVVTADAYRREQLLAALRSSLTGQSRILGSGDVGEFSGADVDFHRLLVAEAGNPLLAAFYDSLRDRQRRMTALSLARDPRQSAAILADHEQLADHIANAQPERFAAALWEHMRAVHGLAPSPPPGGSL